MRYPWLADAGWTRRDVEDLLFYGVLGVVVGGRIGYALFYKPGYYAAHPLEVLAVWQGGMSFHGGLLGVLAAMALFARTRGRSVPAGDRRDRALRAHRAGSGRIGNFINGELWGRAADPSLPWAMVFPQSGSMLPRHPSQLYQFALEGLLLFVLLWWYAQQAAAPRGRCRAPSWSATAASASSPSTSASPTASSACSRSDMSQGQWLCLPMVAAGVWMWWWATRRGAR